MSELQNGVVRWFDNVSGEGMIRDSSGRSIYVHYSAIDVGHDIHSKQVWRVLFKGQQVQMQVIEDYSFAQVSYVGGES